MTDIAYGNLDVSVMKNQIIEFNFMTRHIDEITGEPNMFSISRMLRKNMLDSNEYSAMKDILDHMPDSGMLSDDQLSFITSIFDESVRINDEDYPYDNAKFIPSVIYYGNIYHGYLFTINYINTDILSDIEQENARRYNLVFGQSRINIIAQRDFIDEVCAKIEDETKRLRITLGLL